MDFRDLPAQVDKNELMLCAACGSIVARALRAEHLAWHAQVDGMIEATIAAFMDRLAADSPKVTPIQREASAG